jgi:hypothetical protein
MGHGGQVLGAWCELGVGAGRVLEAEGEPAVAARLPAQRACQRSAGETCCTVGLIAASRSSEVVSGPGSRTALTNTRPVPPWMIPV